MKIVEQARANVLEAAKNAGETLTERQVVRRTRNRVAWRIIGTVGIGIAKIAGGAAGAVVGTIGEALSKTVGKPK